jgi:hypothetical protein
MSSTAVKGIFSPHTRKQCSSGLHIWIRNCNKYSCARINGHSKNFSNPQVAKVARTPGPSMATASRSWAQSLSRHRTGIVTTVHLQTTQSPISAHATINNIKKTHFLPFNLASKGGFCYPQARTHARLFTTQARIYVCLFTAQVCISAHLFSSQARP